MNRREPTENRRSRRTRTLPGGLWPWLLILAAGPLGLLAGALLRPDPARPVLSVQEIDFGRLKPGESAVREITLRNAGEAALRLVTANLESAVRDFQLDVDGCMDRVLAGGGECTMQVRFDPTFDGEFLGKLGLSLASDGEALPNVPEIRIAGRAESSRLEASPETADYGRVTVGQYGPRHAVELTNTGAAPLHVRSMTLSGLAAADFVRASGDCAGRDLAPQSACRVEFDFVPTIEGERRADVVVDSDADQSGALPELLGFGVEPRPGLSVSPVVLDFGPVRAGSERRDRKLRLLNDGDARLRLVDVGLTRGDAGFRLDAGDCARGTLAAGASCELEIRFRPRAEGETTSVLEIEHDAGGGTKRVPLTGIGTMPRLQISDSPLFVGRVAVGRVGEWHELELRNTGSADLTIHSLRLEGQGRRSFEMAADGCRGVVLPGTSCAAQFRIAPRRKGPQRVEVIVRHDGPGGSTTLTVNGLGL